MESFTNNLLNIENLPDYTGLTTVAVHPDYWRVIVINFVINFIFWGSVISAAIWFIPKVKPFSGYLIVAFLLIISVSFFLQKMAFSKRSYALREHDILYRRGVLATINTIIPFSRIQHITINEGFISRYYSLATLQIFTAGNSSMDMKISGLKKMDAEKIKELILQQIATEEPLQTKPIKNEENENIS